MRGRGDAAATRLALGELARLYGVQTSYRAIGGRRVTARREALVSVLRALGAPIERPADAADAVIERRLELARRCAEPVTVAWEGRLGSVEVQLPARAAARRVRLAICAEGDGDEPSSWVETTAGPSARAEMPDGFVALRLPLDRLLPDERPLPTGYHRLFIEHAGGGEPASSLLMAAPRRMPQSAGRPWGLFVPLHGVPSTWGVGSFRDLGRLHGWLRERGGHVLGTLPLLAAFLDEPYEPSPYSPASRLFWNELYLDVLGAPSSTSAPTLDDDAGIVGRLSSGAWVDPRASMAAKRRVLEPDAEAFFAGSLPQRYTDFVSERPEVRSYARFRQEVDRRRTSWMTWPEPGRAGVLPGRPEDDPFGRYHLYVQWLADEQLTDHAGRGADGSGLYLDLPLSAAEASFDVWRHRESFAIGISAGAPADPFFADGQSWGFPPLHPDGIRRDGYGYPIACVQTLLRHASFLRIDHVMGMHRVFWIPEDIAPEHGVYVRYRPEEWHAALSIEANRTGAVVVGEDLGTVPQEVRAAMRRHGMLRSYVVQLEVRADPTSALTNPPAGSMATVSTHDLPMWAAFWEGDDVLLSRELGIIGERRATERLAERELLRSAIAAFLRSRGLAEGEPTDEAAGDVADMAGPALSACLSFLAKSDAAVVVATLEDLWLERRPQNVPGTGAEQPNWRGRLAFGLEELAADVHIAEVLSRIDQGRRAGLHGRPVT